MEFWACEFFLENLTGDYFVRHAWSPQWVFFHDWKFFLEAGGILSLCNYAWKLPWRLFCYACIVCAIYVVAWWKNLFWGRWNSWACVIVLENLTEDCFVTHFSITKENKQCTPCVLNDTICNPIVQEMLDKLKIPDALSKNFPSRNKIDSANLTCLTKQSQWSSCMDKLKVPTALSKNFH